jgi:hypothetical protein
MSKSEPITDKLLNDIIEHPGAGWTSLEVDLAKELKDRRAAKVEKVNKCCMNCGNSSLHNPDIKICKHVSYCDEQSAWIAVHPKPQCPDMGGSCVEVCGYQHKGKCDNGIDEAAKPKLEQTAGEGAIAIPTLADVPIGAVAVIRTANAVWESLVVAKSAGYTFVGNSIKWPDTRIVERWYWPQDAVNRMREGK